jgi:hypothetical protein
MLPGVFNGHVGRFPWGVSATADTVKIEGYAHKAALESNTTSSSPHPASFNPLHVADFVSASANSDKGAR